MKHEVCLILLALGCIFQRVETAKAQDSLCVSEGMSLTLGAVSILPRGLSEDTASSKPRMSVVPIIAFGVGGLVVGYVVGHKIDPGSQPPGEFSLSPSLSEKRGMLAGLATGVSIGYILAKRDQRREQEKREAIEQKGNNKGDRK